MSHKEKTMMLVIISVLMFIVVLFFVVSYSIPEDMSGLPNWVRFIFE